MNVFVNMSANTFDVRSARSGVKLASLNTFEELFDFVAHGFTIVDMPSEFGTAAFNKSEATEFRAMSYEQIDLVCLGCGEKSFQSPETKEVVCWNCNF